MRHFSARHTPLGILSLFAGMAMVCAQNGLDIAPEELAQIYINEYQEPEAHLILTEDGAAKAQALTLLSIGYSLESSGKTDQALDKYREVLKIQPGNFKLTRKVAYLLANNQEPEEGERLLRLAFEQNQSLPEAHITLSAYLSTYHSNRQEKKQEAVNIAKSALEQFPANPAAYRHLVELQLQNKQRDQAKATLIKALDVDSSDASFWLSLGKLSNRLWPRESADDAKSKTPTLLHEKALAVAEGAPEVIEPVGDFYHSRKNLKRAEEIYRQLIDSRPDLLRVRQKIAKVYSALNDTENLIKTYQGILEITPENEAVHRSLAAAFLKQQKIDPAIHHLREALRVGQGTKEQYIDLARRLLTQGKETIAAEVMEEAAFKFRDEPSVIAYFARCLSYDGRYKDAIEQFAKAEKLAEEQDPSILDERFYFSYGTASEQAGDLDAASKWLRKSIELIGKRDPNNANKEFNAQVYNYLGYTWLDNDMNVDQAGELIKEAARLDPQSGAIADSLGWFYFKVGKFKEARDELLRAEQLLDTPDPVIYDHIAQAFYNLGNLKEAISYMKKAVALEDHTPEMKQRLNQYQKAPEEPADSVDGGQE